MNEYNQRTKTVRQALKYAFGNSKEVKKISVRKGTGTASNWIHINIDTPLEDRDALNRLSQDIERIAEGSLRANKHTVPTFLSDDGYNTELSCISVNLVRA
jgi:hypothetical protein